MSERSKLKKKLKEMGYSGQVRKNNYYGDMWHVKRISDGRDILTGHPTNRVLDIVNDFIFAELKNHF